MEGVTEVPFKFEYDSTSGKYGYRDGADTFHPFNDGSGATIISKSISGSTSWSRSASSLGLTKILGVSSSVIGAYRAGNCYLNINSNGSSISGSIDVTSSGGASLSSWSITVIGY